MTLNESIGRFHVRKSLRFEMKPFGMTAERLDPLLVEDEERAAALNMVKAVIEAEHLALIRRVFKSLPDPLPSYSEIKEAFKSDPQFGNLSGRNANAVLKLVLDRCRYNRWAVPKQLRTLDGWQPLFIKWHWHCFDQYTVFGENAVAREWAGRSKAQVEASSKVLRTPRKRKPERGLWFDHAPFRMMFDNHSCGMSWLKEDFRLSRTFLLRDKDRILIGIVPRGSKFTPYSLGKPLPLEQSYLLYVETAGEHPQLRPIPRALIDAPANRGGIFLFELAGRGLRNKTNLNAQYLRALLTEDNCKDPAFHLDKVCEFHVRKGMDIPHKGKPTHFRQRFTEDKFFITLHVTCNPQLVAGGKRPQPFGDLAKFIGTNPYAKFITVSSVTGGYMVEDVFLPTMEAKSGGLSGLLAKLVVERDAYVLFDPSVPTEVRERVVDKFGYIVVRGKDTFADGGIMRGYQLVDRLFAGRIHEAQIILDERKAEAARKKAALEAAEKARAAKLAEKEAKRLKAEEELRKANERRALREAAMVQRSAEVFDTPIFQTGRYLFKFGYKTSDSARHEQTCRADSKSEVFQKLRKVGIRPYRVECDDPDFVDIRKDLPGPDVGSKTFEYVFRDSGNVQHVGTILADTRDEAYAKLRKMSIKPCTVDELGAERPQKRTDAHPVPTPPPSQPNAPAPVLEAPPPISAASASLSIADRLKRLNSLKEQGLLTETEYAEQRARIISEL